MSHNNKKNNQKPEWTENAKGYSILPADDYLNKKPSNKTIVAYTRCTTCYTKISLTEWDDPDEKANTHCTTKHRTQQP